MKADLVLPGVTRCRFHPPSGPESCAKLQGKGAMVS
jgi:hypothetical protein